MKKIILLYILMTANLLIGCAVKSPKEYASLLNEMPITALQPLPKLELSKVAAPLKFGTEISTILESTDPAVLLDPKNLDRSYAKVFKFRPQAAEQVLEVHAFPYKPVGFGQVGIINPYLFFFDEKGKNISARVQNLYFDYDKNFVDGEFVRAAFKLKNLSITEDYYIVVTSPVSKTGQPMKSFKNYGGAVVGVITTVSVQTSPVGKFTVLQTDQFKK